MKPRSGGLAPRSSQAHMRGMTTIGLAILVAFLGMFVFAGIQLAPAYLNYMKVAGALDGVKAEFEGANPTVGSMRRSLGRRFDVEGVSVIVPKDVNIALESGGYRIDADYDHSVSYLGNVSFTVHFKKSVVVRR
ncbi:MAG: DUF4845 domain-containing protein [Woeseia sp.]|nr:DUF4845 domain-containing protein [Woeseia sp.]MBT8097061.1 DUF4845 domain-containing protein [Woeseia sp.]NNE59753.1 DUF4845 domain-containing protein [Woeseia sp.]NNL54945.1 DUF4845 domain-containing protein [Woeseia sp.]